MPLSRTLIAATALAAAAGSYAAAAPALAGGTLPTVTVRIEGAAKTLLVSKQVVVPKGSITTGGAPSGACPGDTAQGALQAATKGTWVGKYYSQYKEFFITSILGEKPKGKGYWGLYVNNTYSSAGACQVTAKAGQTILFADVPEKPTEYPLAISLTSAHATTGHATTVKVLGYNAKGKASPEPGVTVTAGKATVKTGSTGTATFTPAKIGTLTVTASKPGWIRDEQTVDVAAGTY